MRIPRALAWLLVGMGVFTAGLLRQYHDLTPGASFLGPAVGSLLFGCILFLFLVAARERQIGAAPGPGIRVGSLTPLLLMLLGEKWISSSAYPALFARIAPADLPPESADAWFRLLCGVGLLAVVLVTSRFSAPAAAWVGRRLAPALGSAADLGRLSVRGRGPSLAAGSGSGRTEHQRSPFPVTWRDLRRQPG